LTDIGLEESNKGLLLEDNGIDLHELFCPAVCSISSIPPRMRVHRSIKSNASMPAICHYRSKMAINLLSFGGGDAASGSMKKPSKLVQSRFSYFFCRTHLDVVMRKLVS
jgi:hypothetical protein